MHELPDDRQHGVPLVLVALVDAVGQRIAVKAHQKAQDDLRVAVSALLREASTEEEYDGSNGKRGMVGDPFYGCLLKTIYVPVGAAGFYKQCMFNRWHSRILEIKADN